MQCQKTASAHVLKIEQGEDVITSLTAYCKKEAIENAHFTGIGAVDFLRCGHYALGEKKYYFTEYDQLLEVVSMTGNIILKEGEPFVHVHGVFTGTDNNAFGGHIDSMRVGVVLEVILTPLSSAIERKPEEHIGLALMQMDRCG